MLLCGTCKKTVRSLTISEWRSSQAYNHRNTQGGRRVFLSHINHFQGTFSIEMKCDSSFNQGILRSDENKPPSLIASPEDDAHTWMTMGAKSSSHVTRWSYNPYHNLRIISRWLTYRNQKNKFPFLLNLI